MAEPVGTGYWKAVGTWVLSAMLAAVFLFSGGTKLAGQQMPDDLALDVEQIGFIPGRGGWQEWSVRRTEREHAPQSLPEPAPAPRRPPVRSARSATFRSAAPIPTSSGDI